jgi:hypothetical protein
VSTQKSLCGVCRTGFFVVSLLPLTGLIKHPMARLQVAKKFTFGDGLG